MTLLFRSSVDSAQRWQAAFSESLPDIEVRVWPDIGNPADIECAVVWRPPAGLLASLPNLKLIASLGAGVDHIFADPQLPRHVPVVRLVDPHMVQAMSEYVLFQVLRLHRQDVAYMAQQRRAEWRELLQPNAQERRIGILGLGLFGSDVGRKIAALGFDVAGWSRGAKALDGIRCFHGESGLGEMLARTDILVCLLPLTPATEKILCARTFVMMPRGAAILNVGRGRHLVEEDLVAALDSGQLSAAVLDVFHEEPLPKDHPFWRDERIVVTPHIAAATNPATAAWIIADNIRRAREGRPLLNVVDPAQQY